MFIRFIIHEVRYFLEVSDKEFVFPTKIKKICDFSFLSKLTKIKK